MGSFADGVVRRWGRSPRQHAPARSSCRHTDQGRPLPSAEVLLSSASPELGAAPPPAPRSPVSQVPCVAGSSLPDHRSGGLPAGLTPRGGDGSLLFPHRLSHHSMPGFTPRNEGPQGSSGRRLQALHPFLGLRPHAHESRLPGAQPLLDPACDAAGVASCDRLAGCTLRCSPRAGLPPRCNAQISPHAGRLLRKWLGPASTGRAPASRCERSGRTACEGSLRRTAN